MFLKLIVLVLIIGAILVSFNVFSRRNLKKDKNNVSNEQADPEEMISCNICDFRRYKRELRSRGLSILTVFVRCRFCFICKFAVAGFLQRGSSQTEVSCLIDLETCLEGQSDMPRILHY